MLAMLESDRRLLADFREGRPEALKAVYMHYQPRVAAFLRGGFSFQSGDRWLRFRGYSSAFEVGQAVHETMARAFLPGARADYDGIRPYVDYLLGIARNYVLNDLRRNERLIAVGGAEDLEPARDAEGPIGPAMPPAEVTLEEREVERLLETFLGELEERDRRLFVLRFREERNQEEAAAALGLTRIQVRRSEYKLKERLLYYLKRHGYLTRVSKSVLGARLGSVLS